MKIQRFKKFRFKVDDYVWYSGDIYSDTNGIYEIAAIDEKGEKYPYYIKSITTGGSNFVKKFQIDDTGEEYSQWASEDELEYISDDERDLDMFLDMKKYNL